MYSTPWAAKFNDALTRLYCIPALRTLATNEKKTEIAFYMAKNGIKTSNSHMLLYITS